MTDAINKRLIVVNLMDAAGSTEMPGNDVVAGLCGQPKSLPPKYFYNSRGSALFEKICALPEYYPTRTETAILQQYGSAIAQKTGPCEIVELGSGSSTKSRILLDAYLAAGYPLRYLPVDVSDTMLSETAERLFCDYPTISIHALAGTYETALKALPAKQLPTQMIAFIGSTIGNLQPSECENFLAQISETLQPGDYFLLGLDLQKEISVLEAAYNDAQGITAAFNLNMLRHLNQRFEGDFDLARFSHIALYNQQAQQIEMHLESLETQTVHLKALDLTVELEAGDRILSEISRKFNLEEIAATLLAHQLQVIEAFTDTHQWFGLLLCQRTAD